MEITPWAAGMDVTAARLRANGWQAGEVLVSFANLTNYTQEVVFPEPFDTKPVMFADIASGAGETARWAVRPINVTTAGFVLFAFAMEQAAPVTTWNTTPVSWLAVAV